MLCTRRAANRSHDRTDTQHSFGEGIVGSDGMGTISGARHSGCFVDENRAPEYRFEVMPECCHSAVLIITQSVEGTTTNIARARIVLTCREPCGHAGPHRDPHRGETWEGEPDRVTTLLRHESEEGAPRRP